MSLFHAVKIAFIKDIEDTIKKHKDFPLGQFASKIDAAETMGMISAWERAIAHFKLICDTLENGQAPAAQAPMEVGPNVTDAEVVLD